MSIFNSSSLEEVFLTLSQKQDEAGGTVVHSSHVRICVFQLCDDTITFPHTVLKGVCVCVRARMYTHTHHKFIGGSEGRERENKN
jgi:ABC-type uncharacterized transport system ATPase subunit